MSRAVLEDRVFRSGRRHAHLRLPRVHGRPRPARDVRRAAHLRPLLPARRGTHGPARVGGRQAGGEYATPPPPRTTSSRWPTPFARRVGHGRPPRPSVPTRCAVKRRPGPSRSDDADTRGYCATPRLARIVQTDCFSDAILVPSARPLGCSQLSTSGVEEVGRVRPIRPTCFSTRSCPARLHALARTRRCRDRDGHRPTGADSPHLWSRRRSSGALNAQIQLSQAAREKASLDRSP